MLLAGPHAVTVGNTCGLAWLASKYRVQWRTLSGPEAANQRRPKSQSGSESHPKTAGVQYGANPR